MGRVRMWRLGVATVGQGSGSGAFVAHLPQGLSGRPSPLMNVETTKRRWYDEEKLDNDSSFREMIYEAVSPPTRVLDAGAGVGDLFQYDLKGRVKEVLGVDLDARVSTNPQLHRGIVADLSHIPIGDGSCDVVFSRYVLEHIADPQAFLREVNRILKPGGDFLFLTPNRRHYVALAARVTPHCFHSWYNRLRGRDEEDTFPTHYRLNSAASLRRNLERAGFRENRLVFLECCPNYLAFSLPSFLAGVAYERIVNSTDLLAHLRVNIMGWYSKPK